MNRRTLSLSSLFGRDQEATDPAARERRQDVDGRHTSADELDNALDAARTNLLFGRIIG